MKRQSSRNESGVALLMALFALMLLTGVAFAMLFSTDMESNINRNYREQQRAYFAAQAGLAEVRERLTTSNTGAHLIVGPPTMPGTPNSVLYVINPLAGQAVDPTNPANRFFDTELCHEGFVGLAMTDPGPNIPCPSPATAPGVYAPFINSDAPYNSTAGAMDYKWVRITKKANKTAYPLISTLYVDGGADATTHDSEICWNGLRETVRPLGYVVCSAEPPPPQFTYMRDVFILTSLAVTPSGARRMAQFEVAHDPPMVTNAAVDSQDHVSLSGQLTVNGYDYCSCLCTKDKKTKITTCVSRPGKVCDDDKWAIYSNETVDNPNASEVIIAGPVPPIAQSQPWFYDIPAMVETFAGNPMTMDVRNPPYNYSCTGAPLNCGTQNSQTFGTLPTPFPPVDSANPIGGVNQITYSPGDLKLTAGSTGAGILVVDGDLEINGGLQFFGLILVKGVISFTGGGADPTNISGAVLAGQQSLDTTVLGGSANIQFDICALQNDMAPQPPRVIGYRELHY